VKQLQWGGRFSQAPDAELIAFGSSLEEDLVLAPFDVACSRAHVAALEGGGIISASDARALAQALDVIAGEIASESASFAASARSGGFEDVHGAIDARVRELAGTAGASLHAGRSRNDQVVTMLTLYARDRAEQGMHVAHAIASHLIERAREELAHETVLAGTTHWQPAQPILLAFWLSALAEMFARAAKRFAGVVADASRWSPLGSGAIAGSSLPLDRAAAAEKLAFAEPSRNAMDSIGTRDVALDLAHAYVRAVVDASRASEEFVIWCTPAFGYARLGDSASTGSSLMPQKRNPDPFELVRSQAAALNGAYAGALGTLSGIALSYHRDLQTTKRITIEITERGLATLRAFARALHALTFNRERMSAAAANGFTVATDLADALIAQGKTAREAHSAIGEKVAEAEARGEHILRNDNGAEFDALESVRAKKTVGSTSPSEVAHALDALSAELDALAMSHGIVEASS
jgi:argininosuccinate lyase